MLEVEWWKPIVLKGIKTNYSVSTLGRVRNDETGIVLKQSKDKDGYHQVTICLDSNTHLTKRVHRLVAEAFIENPDLEHFNQVNHIKGDKDNNCVDNLEWIDSLGNIHHAYENELNTSIGENHGMNKYSEKKVRKVCKLLEKGWKIKDISKKLDVSEEVISGIKNGHSWKHISRDYEFPIEIKRKYTDEEKHKVCKMIADNYTNAEISEDTGIDKMMIESVRSRNKWTKISVQYEFPIHNPTKLDPETVEKICELIVAGDQNAVISRKTGVPKHKIKAIRARRTYTEISKKYDF